MLYTGLGAVAGCTICYVATKVFGSNETYKHMGTDAGIAATIGFFLGAAAGFGYGTNKFFSGNYWSLW